MPRSRRLAAAQTVPVAGDVAANVAQHVALAARAADAGAAVVVFPELSLTGYELALGPQLAFSCAPAEAHASTSSRAEAHASTPDDPRLTPLIEIARARGLTMIAGAPVRIGAALHIGAFVIGPAGILAIHTKRYLSGFDHDADLDGPLPPLEDTLFTPGALCPLIDLGDQRAVVAICAESFQRSVMKDAVERGAETYLTCHFSVPRDRALRIAGLGKFAAHARMAVVFSNYGGPTAGLSASGGSAILSPSGELLCELGPRGAGLAVAREHESGWQTECVQMALD